MTMTGPGVGQQLDETRTIDIQFDYTSLVAKLSTDPNFISALVHSAVFQQYVTVTATNISRNTFTAGSRRLKNLLGKKAVPGTPPTTKPGH
jgi:hypothetical protein